MHLAVSLEGERLSVVRSERDDAGEIVSVIEESLPAEAAALLSSTTPERHRERCSSPAAPPGSGSSGPTAGRARRGAPVRSAG